jgi:hypothetical protein
VVFAVDGVTERVQRLDALVVAGQGGEERGIGADGGQAGDAEEGDR